MLQGVGLATTPTHICEAVGQGVWRGLSCVFGGTCESSNIRSRECGMCVNDS